MLCNLVHRCEEPDSFFQCWVFITEIPSYNFWSLAAANDLVRIKLEDSSRCVLCRCDMGMLTRVMSNRRWLAWLSRWCTLRIVCGRCLRSWNSTCHMSRRRDSTRMRHADAGSRISSVAVAGTDGARLVSQRCLSNLKSSQSVRNHPSKLCSNQRRSLLLDSRLQVRVVSQRDRVLRKCLLKCIWSERYGLVDERLV